MNEESAFIGAIAEQPEDDTPRLAFADWLQEHGDESRAEFIRVQCEVAQRGLDRPGGSSAVPTHRCKVCGAFWVDWPNEGGWSLCSALCGKCCGNVAMGEQIERLSADESALVNREWELLSAHGREWANGIIPDAQPSNWSPHNPTPYLVLPGPTFVNIDFRRGFVGRITCSAIDWFQNGDTICERHPVTYVRFTSVPEFMFDRIVKLEGGRATVVKYNKWPRVEVELPQSAEISSEAVSGLMRTISQQFVF